MARTIIVKGDPIQFEAAAAAALNPGDLLEVTSTGAVQKHSTASSNAERAFARENDIIGGDTATAYASGDNVLYAVTRSGDVVYARVAAGASAIAIGDYVESAGDGTLQKVATAAATADTKRASVIGVALEAVDNSGGSADAWLKIRAL